MNYIALKENDVRQEGDEQKEREIRGSSYFGFTGYPSKWQELKAQTSNWRAVALLGHRILASDLVHLEFRRPIK